MLVSGFDELGRLTSVRGNGTLFVSVNDSDGWARFMRELRDSCTVVNMSDDCKCPDTPPLAQHTLTRLKAALRQRDAVLVPFDAALRMNRFPGGKELVNWLLNGKKREHRLIVPLLSCPERLAAQIRAAQDANGDEFLSHYELPGELDAPSVYALARGLELPLPMLDGIRAFLTAFESSEPPKSAYVSTHWPLLFTGNISTCCNRAYSAARMLLPTLDMYEPRGTDAEWKNMLSRLDELEELIDSDPDDLPDYPPDDPLHFARLLRESERADESEYLLGILRNHSAYDDMRSAAALAIFDVQPESAAQRLTLRRERAKLIRELGMESMPETYWQRLAEVDRRSKLLYTSLATDDERRFCEKYLLDDYHLSREQLAQREDLRLLYPEILERA